MITLLIQPDEVTNVVGFNDNIDFDNLRPAIEVAQNINLYNFLGLALITKLQSGNLTGVYSTISNDYVKPILAWHSASIYLSLNTFKTANNGNFKLNGGDGDVQPTPTEIKEQIVNHKNVALSYESKFLDYAKTIEIPEFKIESSNKTNMINWY